MEGPAYGRRHVVGLGCPQIVCRGSRRVTGAPEHRNRRTGARGRAGGRQGDVAGLGRYRQGDVLGVVHQGAERRVDPIDDGLGCPEVRGELDHPTGLGSETGLGGEKGGHVGAAEAVDRLLGVTDDEQVAIRHPHLVPWPAAGRVASGVGGGDAHGELDLDGVGVLKLVEQQPLVPRVQSRPHRRPVLGVTKEGAGEHEQIVELELSGTPAIPGGIQRELADDAAQSSSACLGDLGPDGAQPVARLAHAGPQHLEVAVEGGLPADVAELEAGGLRLRIRMEGLEQVELVGDGPDLGHPLGDRVEPEAQSVAGISARFGADLVDERQCGSEQGRNRWRVGFVLRHALLHEVPVVVEDLGQRAERVESDARGQEEQDRASQRRVGEQSVTEPGPPTIESRLGADLVEHFDPGRQARLDRVFGEQPPGEGMQGPDGGAIELIEGGAAAGSVLAPAADLGTLLELLPDAVA